MIKEPVQRPSSQDGRDEIQAEVDRQKRRRQPSSQTSTASARASSSTGTSTSTLSSSESHLSSVKPRAAFTTRAEQKQVQNSYASCYAVSEPWVKWRRYKPGCSLQRCALRCPRRRRHLDGYSWRCGDVVGAGSGHVGMGLLARIGTCDFFTGIM
jgi:hypothetical protein